MKSPGAGGKPIYLTTLHPLAGIFLAVLRKKVGKTLPKIFAIGFAFGGSEPAASDLLLIGISTYSNDVGHVAVVETVNRFLAQQIWIHNDHLLCWRIANL